MFWRKKADDTRKNAIRSAEYEDCLRRFAKLDTGIEVLASKVELIKTDLANLRGKLNNRLEGLKVEKKEEEQKDLNSSGDVYLG